MTKDIEKHNELLTLYKDTLSEIARNKALPWKINIANCVLSGFLTIMIVNIKMQHCLDCFAPFIFAILVAYLGFVFFSCYVVGSCFDKVATNKIILSKLYSKFGSDFNDIIGNNKPDKLEFGEITLLVSSIAFPVFLLLLLVILCLA